MGKSEMLKILYALDEKGKVCKPDTAPKGGKYYCPQCSKEVTLRHGEIRTAHFSHRGETGCTHESILHKIAKLLIIDAIENRREEVRIQRHCEICGTDHFQPIPDDILSAIPEHRLESGYIADIALLDQHGARVAIEVHVTHLVGSKKEGEIGIPFIEVEGADVVADPTILKPIKNTLKKHTCKQCQSDLAAFLEKCKIIAFRDRLTLPKAFFRYTIMECWNCRSSIIVFSWRDYSNEPDASLQIKPPKTIQKFKNQVSGNRWVNVCSKCLKKQGKFFPFPEPEWPFDGLGLTYADDDFETDMKKITQAYKRKGYPLD
jgi:hypothetical protein